MLVQMEDDIETMFFPELCVSKDLPHEQLALRAECELNIPENYFNLPQTILPREISAFNRYLELHSYQVLDEYTLVKRDVESGVLIGTYELWTAVQKAIERQDLVALEKYLVLFSDKQHEFLRKEVFWDKHALYTRSLHFLQDYYSLEKKEPEKVDVFFRVKQGDEEALKASFSDLANMSEYNKGKLFLCSIRSGRQDFFEKTFSALWGKKVFLERCSFSDKMVNSDNIKEIYPLKSSRSYPGFSLEQEEELINAALASANPSIVDYFRNYFDRKVFKHSNYEDAAYRSLWNKVKPVEFLSIVQRLALHTYIEDAIKQGNTDVLAYLLQSTHISRNKIHRDIYPNLQHAMGNIPMLSYLCNYLSQNKLNKKTIYLLDDLLEIYENKENNLLYPESINIIGTKLKPELDFALVRLEYKKAKKQYLS